MRSKKVLTQYFWLLLFNVQKPKLLFRESVLNKVFQTQKT